MFIYDLEKDRKDYTGGWNKCNLAINSENIAYLQVVSRLDGDSFALNCEDYQKFKGMGGRHVVVKNSISGKVRHFMIDEINPFLDDHARKIRDEFWVVTMDLKPEQSIGELNFG